MDYLQIMPDKENGVGILGTKQGGGCIRGLFSQVVQPEISRINVPFLPNDCTLVLYA